LGLGLGGGGLGLGLGLGGGGLGFGFGGGGLGLGFGGGGLGLGLGGGGLGLGDGGFGGCIIAGEQREGHHQANIGTPTAFQTASTPRHFSCSAGKASTSSAGKPPGNCPRSQPPRTNNCGRHGRLQQPASCCQPALPALPMPCTQAHLLGCHQGPCRAPGTGERARAG
jgi:hypothetical protein